MFAFSTLLSGTEEVIWTCLKQDFPQKASSAHLLFASKLSSKVDDRMFFPATCPKSFEEAYLCHYYSTNDCIEINKVLPFANFPPLTTGI